MTLDEVLARVDADIAALGPEGAKAGALDLVDDFVGLGINPWYSPKFGTLFEAADEIEVSDGSVEQLGCVVACLVRCALVAGGLPEQVFQKYVDRMT